MSLIPKKPDSYPVPFFDEITMILFGTPGSGKTTFFAGDKNTLFIGTEPGQDFTHAAVVPCYNWETFINLINEVNYKRKLINDKKIPIEDCPYTSFTIDIVDNLSAFCRDFICRQKNIAYPPTNDFGKTWSEINNEWKLRINQLLMLGNVRFITHCLTQSVEVTLENGMNVEIDKQSPTFSGNKMAQYLDGIVNAMGYAFVDKTGNHLITFVQSATCSAKDRTDILKKCGIMPLNWKDVSKRYKDKAKELGFEVKSRRGLNYE